MKHSLCAIALTLACGATFASPADSVILPDVERGEREIELATGSHRNSGRDDGSGLMLSFGAGVTDWWATEFGIELERERGEHLRYEGIEWENRFRLLDEEDEAPLGLSLLVGIERAREREEGWSGVLGLLSEKKLGRFLLNANVLLERTWASEEENETTLAYQWQLKYRQAPRFHYGVQSMGELGRWNDWNKHEEQEHKLGPAIFGWLPLGDGQRLNYDVGLLFGLTAETPDQTLRVKLEYEF